LERKKCTRRKGGIQSKKRTSDDGTKAGRGIILQYAVGGRRAFESGRRMERKGGGKKRTRSTSPCDSIERKTDLKRRITKKEGEKRKEVILLWGGGIKNAQKRTVI